MNRGRRRANIGKGFRIGVGNRDGIETAEPIEDFRRTGERPLHGELLVEQHPGRQGKRIAREQLVGDTFLGNLKSSHAAIVDAGTLQTMSSGNSNVKTQTHAKRGTRIGALLAASASVLAVGTAIAPTASAAPSDGTFVRTISCNSANPWPGTPLRIDVDVYTGGTPSDGLPGPAITLAANNTNGVGAFLELTTLTTVNWRNTTTGRSGSVGVPTRSHAANWEAVVHPGKGRVAFTVHQKIGALAFVPMVNPQYSSCRGSAVV